MKTKVLKSDEKGIAIAAKIIRKGGVVAFPTETVYGLGANALSDEACKKIFKAKERPVDNPLIVHIADLDTIDKLVGDFSSEVKKIMSSFWPGPLSIILRALPCIPKTVTAGLGTVALRFPSHSIAQQLIIKSGCPIAAPSANISGRPSATNAEHVFKDFNGKIEAIIDGGVCQFGLESTVIDGTSVPIKILRPGAITYEMLNKIVSVELAITYTGGKVLSPGLIHPHYNPEAEVILVKGSTKELHNKLNMLNKETKNYAVLGLRTVIGELDLNQAQIVEVVDSLELLAERLYSFFRECDSRGIKQIVLHEVIEKELGLALMNRVNKATNVVYKEDQQ